MTQPIGTLCRCLVRSKNRKPDFGPIVLILSSRCVNNCDTLCPNRPEKEPRGLGQSASRSTRLDDSCIRTQQGDDQLINCEAMSEPLAGQPKIGAASR